MKVLIFHASAGEGHRRAALAVESALVRSGLDPQDVSVRDALDFASPFFKKSYTGFYFWCVKHLPALWGIFYDLLDQLEIYNFFYPLRRFYNACHSRRLLDFVAAEKPDWIICTHFFSAEVLGHAKKHKRISARLLALVTDFHPARIWTHSGIDEYWVLSAEAKQTLVQRGENSKRIFPGGFPILTEFESRGDQAAVLKKHGLAEDRLTVLLTTGSFGLGEQERLLSLFNSAAEHIQCMVVCGRNQKLLDLLQSKTYAYPLKVFGFVDFMPELMDAADILVAKPGGATTAEAMAKGVPMIVTGAIPGQETENLKYLLEKNAVFSARTPEEIVEVIHQILKSPKLLEEKSKACECISNPRAAEDVAQLRLKLPEPL